MAIYPRHENYLPNTWSKIELFLDKTEIVIWDDLELRLCIKPLYQPKEKVVDKEYEDIFI